MTAQQNVLGGAHEPLVDFGFKPGKLLAPSLHQRFTRCPSKIWKQKYMDYAKINRKFNTVSNTYQVLCTFKSQESTTYETIFTIQFFASHVFHLLLPLDHTCRAVPLVWSPNVAWHHRPRGPYPHWTCRFATFRWLFGQHEESRIGGKTHGSHSYTNIINNKKHMYIHILT